MKLTVRLIDTFRPRPDRRVELPDDDVPGLALRVTPQGAKTWAVRYRVEGGRRGRLRRLTLGAYPTLTLVDARKKARRALNAVAATGMDPAAAKQAARQGETVADLAREYLEKYAKKHKRSWRDDERYLDADVLPAWTHRKVKELTRRDVRELIEGIADRGSPISANRCLALVRKMLNFAIERDWIEANVASRIAKPGTERSRDRVLSDEEIRLVWNACEAERPAMCALMRLRLLTAQRGGELMLLRWSDVDRANGWLTIPGSVTKNKVPHRVPLSAPAVDILNAVPRLSDEWVFAGRTGRRPLTDAKKAGRRIGHRVLAALQKDDPDVEAFDFRAHDLRRTASTKMAEAGISHADIARVLNHVDAGPRATQVYDRYSYDREKRVALDTWARMLTAILERKATGTVLPFGATGGA
jgi:integrase